MHKHQTTTSIWTVIQGVPAAGVARKMIPKIKTGKHISSKDSGYHTFVWIRERKKER